jgi:hypothetical protein
MGVVQSIRDEVANLKLNGHKDETEVNGTYIRIMELLERQATIIEILGDLDRENLKRFEIESYKP